MDDLNFLILEGVCLNTSNNLDSVMNLVVKNGDFFGYDEEDAKFAVQRLENRRMIVEVVGIAKGYFTCTEEGKRIYMIEKEIRVEKQRATDRQKELVVSIIAANSSLIQTNETVQLTNESVRQTNVSMQNINRIVTANIPVQNKLTRANIWVAIGIGLIALAAFLGGFRHKSDQELIRQLRETNKILQNQAQELDNLLKRQNQMDSVILKRTDSTSPK